MKKKILGVMIGVVAAISLSATAFALDASYVEPINNVGKKDIVEVNGLEPKSVVSVAAENGMLLGKKTVGSSSTTAKVNVNFPSTDGGKITISVLKKGASTPETVTVDYPAEPVSDTPKGAEITNNVDKKDTILVDYLESRDTVTVYNAATGGKKLVTGKVKNGNDEITLSHKQLSTADSTHIWISVTSVGKLESPRKQVAIPAEKQSEVITDKSSITVTNNVGKKGTVEVTDLEAGDTITVYAASEGTKKLGSAKCGKTKTDVKINVAQLSKEAGKVWLTIKRANELASDRFEVYYDAQPVTPDAGSENNTTIKVTNNPAGTSDTIYIDGLEAGDIIKVYTTNDTTKPAVYLKGTVASGKTDVTLTKAQLGAGGATLYISNTRKSMLESARTPLTVIAEVPSEALDVKNITVTNNAGIASTVYVIGLDEGTTITAYDKEEGGKTLGSTKVAAGTTSATINIGSLAVNGGEMWITRKDPDLAESPRVKIEYSGKENSAWTGLTTEVDYNVGMPSTIKVSGLMEGDVVKAYATKTTGAIMGQATRGATDYSITISTSQLKKEGGSVYLTITAKGKIESARQEITYDGEASSAAIDANRVTIENNANTDSEITVYGVSKGETITVYSDETGSKYLCKDTADSNYITFYLSSLKENGGFVYIARQTSGLGESTRTKVEYGQQMSSTAVSSSDVTIVNNAGVSDVITVKKIQSGDTIKIYSSANATSTLATGVAYSTELTIPVAQLGVGSGKVYISVTQNGYSESKRTEVSFSAEKESDKLNDVVFSNRTSTTVDITISGLIAGDVIRLYSDAAGSVSLGGTTAGSDTVVITLYTSSTSSGLVYISRTTTGMHESAKDGYRYEGYVAPTQQ